MDAQINTITQELQAIITAMGATIAEAVSRSAILPPEQKLVDKAWMMDYYNVKLTALNKILAKEGFPAPVKLDDGPLRWVAGEVIEWTMKQRRR